VSFCLLVMVFFLCLLNTQTITRQGINGKVSEISLPLYLKLLSFYDRHLHYQWLLDRIVSKKDENPQKVKKIFEWVGAHIHDQPEKLPVVDDHPWNIVIRGYGISDQHADVFCTLCNYAGIPALFVSVGDGSGSKIYLAAVKWEGCGRICDPYFQVQFVDSNGEWADVSDLCKGDFIIRKKERVVRRISLPDYRKYFKDLAGRDWDKMFFQSRSATQDPWGRFNYFLKDKKL